MKKNYDYVYAIIRVDEYKGVNCPIERKVVVKEVVWGEEEAKREIDRLNALQKPNESFYFAQVTRLLTGGRELDEQGPPPRAQRLVNSEPPKVVRTITGSLGLGLGNLSRFRELVPVGR